MRDGDRAGRDLAGIDHADHGVRPELGTRRSTDGVDEFEGGHGQANLFLHLAYHRGGGCFARVNPAADHSPLVIVGPVHHEQPAVGIKDRRVGPDLGTHVAKILGEALAYFRLGEIQCLRVPRSREFEQPRASLAVVGVGRVVEPGLGDGAELVEQGQAVDGLDVTTPTIRR